MTYLATYKLPNDISAFIASGRQSVPRAINQYASDHNLTLPLNLTALAAVFSEIHHKTFFTASRNNPANIDSEGLRNNLQTMIVGAAALCDVAYQLRQFSRKENLPRHRVRKLLSHEAKDFYLHNTRGEVHPKIFDWMRLAITPEEREENQLLKADTTRGKTILALLEEMFIFPEEATCIRPVLKNGSRASAERHERRQMKMKKLLLSLASFLAVSALAACAGLLNATIPSDGYTITHDISYGDNPKYKLDIYRPEKTAAGAPVIFFIYGGRWEEGSKDTYLFVGQAFASKGFTVVVADYRVYPEVHYPGFTEDSAKALVWTHRHIAQYGGNPDNIFVAGHSAGAYIALMMTSNNAYIEKAGGKPGWIHGAIGLAGPYNFVPSQEDPDIREIFSTGTDTNTQPITYVHKGMPPVFLATGDADDTVKTHNTYDMEKKLKQMGDTVEVHTYPDVAHIGLVLSLANGFHGKAPTLDDIAGFVEKYGVSK